MILLFISLIVAIVLSLHLRNQVIITERCLFKKQMWTIGTASALPILILAMLNIIDVDLVGLTIIATSICVFWFNRRKYIQENQYIVQ